VTKEMTGTVGEPDAAGEPGPQEITCSGGVRLPLLNALRERQEQESGDGE
jgi:hypothetical protein